MLDARVRRIEQGEIDGIEALDQLLVEERTVRENRQERTALTLARLTTVKSLAGFDFAFQPSLDKKRILALAGLTFIDRAEVVHLLGPPGTGKNSSCVRARHRGCQSRPQRVLLQPRRHRRLSGQG